MKTDLMLRYLESLDHEVTEVRILRKDGYFQGRRAPTIISGYYEKTQYEKLIADITPFENDDGTKCIWTTLQIAKKATLARANNRLRLTDWKPVTTGDTDISHFTIFPIDLDSDNPTETSASDDELKRSAERAKEIYRVITEDLGLPAVKAMSGNGCHILIYLEPLEATPENIERFYNSGKIIEHLYKTDIKNYNPARCWKLYETTVRKGDNIEERPHRRSRLIEFPDEIQRVPFIELETNLLTIAPEELLNPPARNTKPRQKQSQPKGKRLPKLENRDDLETFARELGAVPNSEWKSKASYELCRTHCPLCSRDDHGKLTYGSNGECGYSCHSNTCAGKNFQDLYESRGYSKSEYQSPPPSSPKSQASQQIQDDFGTEPPTFQVLHEKDIATIPVFPDTLTDLEPFSLYIEAFKGKTEVCPAFHFATLLTTIGATIGRRAFYNGITPLYPNFFTCICGQTGASRKSTALALGAMTLENADRNVFQIEGLSTPEGLVRHFALPKGQEHGEPLNEYKDTAPIGIDRYIGGDEALLDHMLQHSSAREGFRGLAVIDEMASLFKKANKAGSEGLLQKLSEFYDNKRRIVNPPSNDPTVALNPCLSMMGATTISWLEGNIKVDDITGGIGRRFLYFVDQGEVTDIPLTEPGDRVLLELVEKIIKGIRADLDRPMAYEYNEDAKKEYTEWYYTQRQRQRDEKDEIMKAIGEGIHVHVQKASIIFSIFQNGKGDYKIKPEAIGLAIIFAEYLRECQKYLFASLATSEQEKIDRRVIETLTKEVWLTSRDLYRKLRVSSDLMNRTLDNLLRLKLIGVDNTGKSPKYAVIKED